MIHQVVAIMGFLKQSQKSELKDDEAVKNKAVKETPKEGQK